MTVTSTNRINTYAGAGTTGPFAYTFRIFVNSNLAVFTTVVATGVITPLVLGTDYTMTGAGALIGGTVTTTAAVPVGTTLTLERTLLVEQLSDFRNEGEFFPSDYEDALDYGIMVSQQLSDGVASLLNEVSTINTSITNLTTDVTNNTTNITNLTTTVNSHTTSLTTITGEVTTINGEIAVIENQISGGLASRPPVLVATAYSVAGSFTYTVSAKCTGRVKIKATGAGGGGDISFSGNSVFNNGGGGGAVVEAEMAVTVGQNLALVVGAAGTLGSGAGGSGTGTDGGDTTVNSTLIVAGGGPNGQPYNGSGSATPGGVASGTITGGVLRNGGEGTFSAIGDDTINPHANMIVGGSPPGGAAPNFRFFMTQLGTSATCSGRGDAQGPGCGAAPSQGLPVAGTGGEIIIWEYQ